MYICTVQCILLGAIGLHHSGCGFTAAGLAFVLEGWCAEGEVTGLKQRVRSSRAWMTT